VGFLIDTNLWIAVERGRLSAADIHAITMQEPLYLSPVNVAEVRFGIEMMKDAKQKQRAMIALRRMRRKPLLPITGETAEVFGMLSARLSQAGRGAGFRIQDLWLEDCPSNVDSNYSRPTPEISRMSQGSNC
jgi:predicted nucleic acid-binding protein